MKNFAISIQERLKVAFRVPTHNTAPALQPDRRHMNRLRRRMARKRLPRLNCVHLEFVHRRARRVAIAGSFNDWRPEATPMISLGRGWWVKGLVLPPGRYEYRLVVDGHWLPDLNAPERVPAPDGGINSVLVVPVPTEN